MVLLAEHRTVTDLCGEFTEPRLLVLLPRKPGAHGPMQAAGPATPPTPLPILTWPGLWPVALHPPLQLVATQVFTQVLPGFHQVCCVLSFSSEGAACGFLALLCMSTRLEEPARTSPSSALACHHHSIACTDPRIVCTSSCIVAISGL